MKTPGALGSGGFFEVGIKFNFTILRLFCGQLKM